MTRGRSYRFSTRLYAKHSHAWACADFAFHSRCFYATHRLSFFAFRRSTIGLVLHNTRCVVLFLLATPAGIALFSPPFFRVANVDAIFSPAFFSSTLATAFTMQIEPFMVRFFFSLSPFVFFLPFLSSFSSFLYFIPLSLFIYSFIDGRSYLHDRVFLWFRFRLSPWKLILFDVRWKKFRFLFLKIRRNS